MSGDNLASFDALPDDVVPEAPAQPKPVDEPAGAREMHGLSDLHAKNDANGHLMAIASSFHPFTVIFEKLAVSRYPRLKDKRACVEKHALAAPRLYRFCVVADLVVVSAAVILLFGVLSVSAVKTLFGTFQPLG